MQFVQSLSLCLRFHFHLPEAFLLLFHLPECLLTLSFSPFVRNECHHFLNQIGLLEQHTGIHVIVEEDLLQHAYG